MLSSANGESVEITDKRPMDEIPDTDEWYAALAAAESAAKTRDGEDDC